MASRPMSPTALSYTTTPRAVPAAFSGLPSQSVNQMPHGGGSDRGGHSPHRAAHDRVHEDFANIDDRLKDGHHDEVNEHLMRNTHRRMSSMPTPTRTVVVHDPRLEEDLRTMQDRLAAEHRAREEELRRAEDLLRTLDRQRPDAERQRQRQQNEELQNKLRSEQRMAEDIKSEKDQLRQQVTEMELELAEAKSTASEVVSLKRRLTSMESDLGTERAARKHAEEEWEESLKSHKQRLAHTYDTSQRSMADREAQLLAETKRLTHELQEATDESHAEQLQHADRETEWTTKMADYQAKLSLKVQKQQSAAQARELEMQKENVDLKDRVDQLVRAEASYQEMMSSHQERFTKSIEDVQLASGARIEELTTELQALAGAAEKGAADLKLERDAVMKLAAREKQLSAEASRNQEDYEFQLQKAKSDGYEFCILNEILCIKMTQKRGILYQNHTKTRNFVLKMTNFAVLADVEKLQAQWTKEFRKKNRDGDMMMRLAEFRKDKAKKRQLFAIWKEELVTMRLMKKIALRIQNMVVVRVFGSWTEEVAAVKSNGLPIVYTCLAIDRSLSLSLSL